MSFPRGEHQAVCLFYSSGCRRAPGIREQGCCCSNILGASVRRLDAGSWCALGRPRRRRREKPTALRSPGCGVGTSPPAKVGQAASEPATVPARRVPSRPCPAPPICTMPAEKGDAMEQGSRSKNSRRTRGETTNEEADDGHVQLLPAGGATDGELQSPGGVQSQASAPAEHPRTPAPWSRQRASRPCLQNYQENAGDTRASSRSTSTRQCKKAEAAAAQRGSDHQAWPAECALQAQKKGKRKPLSLKPPDTTQAADVLGDFLGHFLTYLHECLDRPYFRDTRELDPGSSDACAKYEKLSSPGVFEVLLIVPVPDCVQYTEVEGYSGLFYTLALVRKSRSFPAALLLEDGKTLSPRNTMEEFWKHVDQFVRVFYSAPFPGWQMMLEKRKPNCPVVRLALLDDRGAKTMSVNLVPALETLGQWPCARKAKDLLGEEEWPFLTRTFHFVAKQCPGRHNKETWRISFSHVEKLILDHHRSTEACYKYHKTECCRKDCLKMLQDHLEALRVEHPQMLAHLSSYHTWTSFLHTLWEWKADADWKPADLTECFERVLANFIHEVGTAHLAHFFLPKCNLFGAKFFPPTKLKFLRSQLKVKEGTRKLFTMSRKRGYSALRLNPDMTWPLLITFGLIALVSMVLPHVAT